MSQVKQPGGKGMDVNLSTGEVHIFDISPLDRQMYLGGKGLGLKFIFDRLRPGIDPLSEENILVLVMGILLGSGAPCSSRFTGVTKSPLTGIMVSSSCGGPFGMAFKSAGYDILLIGGKSEKPIYLLIDDRGAKILDASHLWGLDTQKTQRSLELDKGDGALAIGPAGENLVRYANIASGHRFLGRGGLGAVMGSKMLKAVKVCAGSYENTPADEKEFRKIKNTATAYINRNPFTGIEYRNYGTSTNVNLCNNGGILPVMNFIDGTHENASLISGQLMKGRFRSKPSTCRPCTILCGHKGTYPDGVHQIPEYETVALFGPNTGNFNIEAITQWNDLCGKLGLDTMTTGATIAYIMEVGANKQLQPELQFGSPEGIETAIGNIAYRRGLGDDMANGTRWLSKKYGGKDFAIHVKGLEMAAYDPRGSWGQGLAYAVANRGACHLSATLFPLEVFFKFLKPYSVLAKPQFVIFFENLYSAVNSISTCLFTTYAYILEPPLVKHTPKPLLSFVMQYLPEVAMKLIDFSIFSRLVSSATGTKISPKQLFRAGERIHVLERYLNTREGISRKDDTLPSRFLSEGRLSDPKRRTVPLDRMLKVYYKLRGYDEDGFPSPSLLNRLGITDKETALLMFKEIL